MRDPGKLKGPKLDTLFEELIEKKTILSMQVVGKDFQRLTCITAVERTSGINYLLVDRPADFSEALGNDESLKLRFNFNGADQLEYLFSTGGGITSGNNLKIPFPDYVERLQRRKNFRIDTLPGTYLSFASGKLKCRIDLINISLGGAFGVLTKPNDKNQKTAPFKPDQRLYRMSIVFPGDKHQEQQTVAIRKAEVRRVERDRERKLFKFAFEFMTVEKEEHEKLTTAIYHIQRQFLQNR